MEELGGIIVYTAVTLDINNHLTMCGIVYCNTNSSNAISGRIYMIMFLSGSFMKVLVNG